MTILHSIKNRYDEYMDAEWIPFLRHLTGRDYHYLTRRQHAIHNICGPKRQVSQSVSFDPDNIGKASGWQSLRAPRGTALESCSAHSTDREVRGERDMWQLTGIIRL